jgi:two-component system, OmpR family, sensor histidine kinase TctE
MLASLRARLVLGLMAVFVLGMAATWGLIASHAASMGEVLEDSSLQAQARVVIAGLRFDARGGVMAMRLPKPWGEAYRQGLASYAVYGPDGRLEAWSASRGTAPALIPLAPGVQASPLKLVGDEQDLALGSAAPFGREVVVARHNPGGAVPHPPDPWEDVFPLGLMAALAVLAVAMAWLVAGWSLGPLRRATDEAAAIGPEQPEARLSDAGLPAEVRPLALAINRALDRVAAAYAAERRFTADAAHALRTPLSVLDLRLQRAQAGGHIEWPVVRADLAELKHVVSGLLSLSRADRAAKPEPREALNLARTVREVAAGVAPALEAEGRGLSVVAPPALAVTGDDRELRDLLYALLDNARVHGRGEVSVTLREAVGHAVLTVADQGEGVPEAEREAMFERFRQRDASRGGAGLGLAIVRQAARNHGGEAHFVDASTVEVRLGL